MTFLDYLKTFDTEDINEYLVYYCFLVSNYVLSNEDNKVTELTNNKNDYLNPNDKYVLIDKRVDYNPFDIQNNINYTFYSNNELFDNETLDIKLKNLIDTLINDYKNVLNGYNNLSNSNLEKIITQLDKIYSSDQHTQHKLFINMGPDEPTEIPENNTYYSKALKNRILSYIKSYLHISNNDSLFGENINNL